MVMMMVSLVMVPRGCEGRDGKDHQQQDGGKNLSSWDKCSTGAAPMEKGGALRIKTGTVHGRLQETRTGVN